MINSLDDELFTEKKETRNPILRHRLEEIIMEDTVATNKVIENYKEFKILLDQQNNQRYLSFRFYILLFALDCQQEFHQ